MRFFPFNINLAGIILARFLLYTGKSPVFFDVIHVMSIDVAHVMSIDVVHVMSIDVAHVMSIDVAHVMRGYRVSRGQAVL